MAPPIHAPVLLSGSTSLPPATADTLTKLAPTGSGPANGAQVIRIGAVPTVKGMRSAAINGSDPYTLAAGIDRFVSARLRAAEQRRGDRVGHESRVRDARRRLGGRER